MQRELAWRWGTAGLGRTDTHTNNFALVLSPIMLQIKLEVFLTSCRQFPFYPHPTKRLQQLTTQYMLYSSSTIPKMVLGLRQTLAAPNCCLFATEPLLMIGYNFPAMRCFLSTMFLKLGYTQGSLQSLNEVQRHQTYCLFPMHKTC